jgi:vacuolar-type H+-ATPase subunit E/Vma4
VELEHVREAVLAEARRQAETIVTEAQRAADERVANARIQLADEHDARLAHAHQEIEEKAALTIQRARSEKARELLARKNAVLDRVFEEAARRFAGIPPDRYAESLADSLARTASDADGLVLLSPRDREALGESLVRTVNERLGRQAVRLADETLQASGGFLFRTDTYEVDHSFETRLRILRKDLLAELAATLFPSE